MCLFRQEVSRGAEGEGRQDEGRRRRQSDGRQRECRGSHGHARAVFPSWRPHSLQVLGGRRGEDHASAHEQGPGRRSGTVSETTNVLELW